MKPQSFSFVSISPVILTWTGITMRAARLTPTVALSF